MKLDIITCPQWDARPPKETPVRVGKAVRIIFHHTAGHHREIARPANESRAEACRYARDIQAFHMGQGWIDSGHNFLVCRNGMILQGRWKTVSAIQKGRMVISAHCPGENTQIGIEHEHAGSEPMPALQAYASSALMAWIAIQYGSLHPLPVDPHCRYFPTQCPANLVKEIPSIVARARNILKSERGQL